MTAALREQSPYLQGNFAPIETEITACDLEVTGELPGDLEGIFVRNSPNPRYTPRGDYHWFDGDGMIHGVEIANGTATYRNRFVRTAGLAADEDAGESLWTGILEPPDFSHPGGPYKDTANTDLVYHNGRLLALWWLGGQPYVIGLPGLDTCGIETFGGNLKTGLSAHPKVDPVTGEMMFIDYQPVPPYLTYGVISADGELVHQAPIELDGPRLQHDIAITPDYSVLMDMSLMWDPEALAAGQVRLEFFEDIPTRFGIIPRRGGNDDVVWFECEPCFMYHTVNAWEHDGRVTMIGCRIPRPVAGMAGQDAEFPALARLSLEPYLHRWEFDLRTGIAKEEQLDDTLTEFPRMDNRILGRRSQYAYSQRVAPGSELRFDGVVKYDTERDTQRVHEYPDGRFGGETVFAPAGDGEDRGYLLTFVADEASGESELYVIDAQNVEEDPVARLRIPQRVPYGYHTWWVGAAGLE